MNNTTKQLVAGFDPGGEGKFGWCVARLDRNKFSVTEGWAGIAHHADGALGCVSKIITDQNSELVAVGIDAPLYWARVGKSRAADNYVRQCLQQKHYADPSGTVQVHAVNSLQGACVAQGIILATTVEQRYPTCLITETHPKALLKACLSNNDIQSIHDQWKNKWSDDQRDAIISAWAAIRAYTADGDINLYDKDKKENILCFLKKTVYWWPKECCD